MHESITGTGFAGRPYRALSPDAWAWVHLSNFDSGAVFLDLFVRPLTDAERERLYADYRQVGRILGISDDDMPPDVGAFRSYAADMIESRLIPNVATHDLLEVMSLSDVPPPHRLVPRPLWAALRPAGRFLLRDASVGTLPPRLREKLGLTWTEAQQRRLLGLAAVVRRTSPAVPARLLHYPPGYRAVRAARSR
jgi:uncharacterized protein (DUF2236 family)